MPSQRQAPYNPPKGRNRGDDGMITHLPMNYKKEMQNDDSI